MVWYENLTTGMAFVDELINLDQDLTVILVDKRAQPGGHWGLFFYKNWLTHLTQIWTIWSPLWRAPGSLANHNTVSEVANLTTAMYPNLLSCLALVREETKLTQIFLQNVTTAVITVSLDSRLKSESSEWVNFIRKIEP